MQLKDVTPIISAILRERDNIPLTIKSKRYLSGWEANRDGNAMRGGLRKALRLIEQAPVADVEIVRYGWWIANSICSVCKQSIDGHAIQNDYEYCPYCGAKLTRGANDENS